MVRRTLIATLAAAALVATPVVAAAQETPTVAGIPTAANAPGSSTTMLADPAVARLPGSSATTASSVPAATSQPPAVRVPAAKAKHRRLRWLHERRVRLSGVLHAQWTTKTKGGTYVTHDAIHGTVGTVGAHASSITVTAADMAMQTYSTSSTTKVWTVTKANGKRHVVTTTLAAVTKDATVIVEGTGTRAPFAATRILVQLRQ